MPRLFATTLPRRSSQSGVSSWCAATLQRILTCFLEYGEQQVTVYDLLHEREGAGWQQRVSSHPKLRLDPQWVVAKLTALGLNARREAGFGGMVRIVAAKT